MEKYNRKSIFTELKKFCHFSNENDFIEATEWKNGEGFDVEISSVLHQRFHMTYGEFKALKKIMKNLEKNDKQGTK